MLKLANNYQGTAVDPIRARTGARGPHLRDGRKVVLRGTQSQLDVNTHARVMCMSKAYHIHGKRFNTTPGGVLRFQANFRARRCLRSPSSQKPIRCISIEYRKPHRLSYQAGLLMVPRAAPWDAPKTAPKAAPRGYETRERGANSVYMGPKRVEKKPRNKFRILENPKKLLTQQRCGNQLSCLSPKCVPM